MRLFLLSQTTGALIASRDACSEYRLIMMIDIFQYSNVYAATAAVGQLYTDRELQVRRARRVRACALDNVLRRDSWRPSTQSACRRPTRRVRLRFAPRRRRPTMRAALSVVGWADVFALYCAMRPPRTVRALCAAHPLIGTRVNERCVRARQKTAVAPDTNTHTRHRRLITFGLVNGLIRRVHVFPHVDAGALAALGASPAASLVRLAAYVAGGRAGARARRLTPSPSPLMTGELSYDAICTTLLRSREDVRSAFASEGVHIFEIAT